MASQTIKIIEDNSKADHVLHQYFGPNLHVEVGKDNYCMLSTYNKWAKALHDFEVRNDDIFLSGFPRSGTTWSQELIWLLVNDLDFECAKKKKQIERAPLLEINTFCIGDGKGDLNAMKFNDMFIYINNISSPRCIKTHLPWSLLPDEITNGTKHPKIIYVYRNPKDVCISYYNFYRLFYGYRGSLDDFCLLFLEGRVLTGPFWKSVLSYWNQRHRPNMLFIKYKDMKADLHSVIEKIGKFLEKNLTSEQIHLLLDYLDITSMKNNPAVNRDDAIELFAKPFNLMVSEENNFIGKGEQNGYLAVMTPELIQKFDEWNEKNLKGTDFIE